MVVSKKYLLFMRINATTIAWNTHNCATLQKIKGTVYVYEDYPYWDSEKKQTRHKRVYIGKKEDNANFIPNKNYLSRTQPSVLCEYRVPDKSAKRRFSVTARPSTSIF
jgi:hypothetical protein